MFVFQWLFLAGYCDDNRHWLLVDACLCYNDSDFESMIISKFSVPFQSFSGVGRKLPLLRVTSSIGWLCGGCSLGWGYCTDRLDLDDLQTPTVAAKALGPTLHVQNFSGLIWKFEIWTNKDSQDYPFWFCDMGLVPTLGCTLGCTLFHFAPKTSPRNGSERFWTIVGVFTHGVWARLDPFLGFFCVYCIIVFLNDFRGFNPPGKDLKRKDSYNTKKNCEIGAGDWAFPRLCAATMAS